MFFENSAKRLSHEILVWILKALKNNQLEQTIDRIIIELRPLGSKTSRCCVYKSRALIKYRAMALLGFDVEEEKDELMPLSEYARLALTRTNMGKKILSIIAPACSGCPKAHFYVSEACRGCMARPCIVNCPKKCISQVGGRIQIDVDSCIMCGKCQQLCPYHAIIKVSVPCEDVCPVGAISKNEEGKACIDFFKCIYCGKCVDICPFGAVIECSQIIDIMRVLASEKTVYALPAPAIVSQFKGNFGQIVSALISIGFHDVVEVALGADEVGKMEAEEFMKKRKGGLPFMTTSCCPAYVHAAQKAIPSILPHISQTPSPLQITAKKVKEKNPQAVTVFIGPCIAKRKESLDDTAVGYYMTFAELAAIFEAYDIKTDAQQEQAVVEPAKKEGRGFPSTGGVINAILKNCNQSDEITTESINGLTKMSLRQLESYANGVKSAELIEVMNCCGGCINGPATIVPLQEAKRRLEQFVLESENEKECSKEI